MSMQDVITFGEGEISIADIVALAHGRARAELSEDLDYQRRVEGSVRVLEHLAERGRLYGVNTGVGDSCDTPLDAESMRELPHNLFRFHGCGTGEALDEMTAASVLAVRLASLSRGYSGVRPQLLLRLVELLNRRILPVIPAEGSVGASGDLTPLSYVAALVAGEREATVDGEMVPAAKALQDAKLTPLMLHPKESLALMNGTSVMTGLACLAMERAGRLARLGSVLTAMASDVLRGRPGHFHRRIFELKPHAGTVQAAAWIRGCLGTGDELESADDRRLQDRYSLRCAPHVLGVLLDVHSAMEPMVAVEVNSVNDNPILDGEEEVAYHGGNFYGGHVCMAMDCMKNAVANLADLCDRQMAILCNPTINNGLPANLVLPEAGAAHHGFKAMSITASALTAEALKLTMPASVFSRSTENHNQDKVSMGTIAARDCVRGLELTERVCAILLLALCQAVDLRGVDRCRLGVQRMHGAVRDVVSMNRGDRRMDVDIEAVRGAFLTDRLPISEVIQ